MLHAGEIRETNNCGKIEILGPAGFTEDGHKLYKVKFIQTGYTTEVSESQIRHKRVKDKLYPSVCGVGCIGRFETNVTDSFVWIFYRTWADMMHRCYNPNDKAYDKYGGIGVVVDISWWSFDNFFRDAQQLPGIEKKLERPDIYQLDKDYKQTNVPKNQRVYSKETCMWISGPDNILLMNIEYGSESGYMGVYYRDNGWVCRISNKSYGKFTKPEAAANMYNHIYPIIKGRFNDLDFRNDVKYIPMHELYKYAIRS